MSSDENILSTYVEINISAVRAAVTCLDVTRSAAADQCLVPLRSVHQLLRRDVMCWWLRNVCRLEDAAKGDDAMVSVIMRSVWARNWKRRDTCLTKLNKLRHMSHQTENVETHVSPNWKSWDTCLTKLKKVRHMSHQTEKGETHVSPSWKSWYTCLTKLKKLRHMSLHAKKSWDTCLATLKKLRHMSHQTEKVETHVSPR